MATKVIFRKFRDGSVIALFPEFKEKNGVLSYMAIGQHSEADYNVIRATKPAKPIEYSSLLNELQYIGYNVRICKRLTR